MSSDGPTENARRRGPRKGREVLPEVLRDLKYRVQTVGMKTYGKPLTTDDGRNTLLDMYEEQLDGVVYTRKMVMEFGDLVDAIMAKDATVVSIRNALPSWLRRPSQCAGS